MSRSREIEVPFFSKAPFANYDLVVYLGGGLFGILIFWRYIGKPFGIFDFSNLILSDKPSSVENVLYLIFVTVFAYVIGHLISYQSSFFIEGFIEQTLGKFSKIIEVTTCDRSDRAIKVREEIKTNRIAYQWFTLRMPCMKEIAVPKPLPFLAHLPLLPWYIFVHFFGFFDFVDTRLPKRMVVHVREKMNSELSEFDFEPEHQWFRWIEYYTSYNRLTSAASMYNYLVISGLMRSLSYLFLLSIWFEIFYLIVPYYFKFPSISHGQDGGIFGWALYFFVLYIGYITTVTSYCKFFRRYVEEAVMGYLLEGHTAHS